MKQRNHLLYSTIASTLLFILIQSSHAEELLLFISAFAPGEQGAIHAFQLSTDSGELKQVHRTPNVAQPFFLALSSDRKYLYATTAPGEFGGKEDEQVAAFEIVGDAGKLKLLNHESSRGSATCYLDVDATGKALVVANYQTGSVASLPIQKDGSLGKAVSFVQHKGSSVNPERQMGPYAHASVISPDNRFVLAADLGLDQILVYKLDSAAAKLTPNNPAFATTKPGAGPRHLTFHPNGKYVYVINELDNTLTFFQYDAKAGKLDSQQTMSTLPEDFKETSYCADVKITPNGRFLYGTNRGHDSIAAFRIGDNGRLTLVAIEPSLGQGPQNLAITPDGNLLVCANMPGNNVVVFRIDGEEGKLKSVGEPVAMPGPSCIMIR
jgi:6-phosphogluconolactonase